MSGKVAIIGIGNKLMGDEGVGIHAVEYLRVLSPFYSPLTKEGNNKADLLDGGTGGMALLHVLEEYDHAIIIDAVDFGGRSGDVRAFVITSGDIQLASDSTQISLHETGFAGILELAKKIGTKLPKITIIAVQPETILPSLNLSEACKKAVLSIPTFLQGLWR